MRRLRDQFACFFLIAWSAALPISAAEPTSEPSQQPTSVVVFDFRGEEGKSLADRVRLRLRRSGYDVLDHISTGEISEAIGIEEQEKLASLLDKLPQKIVLFGSVEQSGDTTTARLYCINRSLEPSREWRKDFSASGQRAMPLLAVQIAEAITQQSAWKPPEYGEEAEPKTFGQPLNLNGSFDGGSAGWELPDQITCFIETDPQRGQILRIRTDLERQPWLDYQEALKRGQKPATLPTIKSDTSYASLAGHEGVHFNSKWIPAQPGKRYWLVADFKNAEKNKLAEPKIFVKGFRRTPDAFDGLPEQSLYELGLTPEAFAQLEPAARKQLITEDAKKNPMRYLRECYRWYLDCPNKTGDWQHYAAPFPPRGGLPDEVEWLQIQIYSFWPPGEYHYDNVFLYADPNQTAPLPEAARRTPNTRKRPATQPAD
jgi:hypothetical protein